MIQETECPDVVGFTVEEARRILKGSGFEISRIITTLPPRQRNMDYNDTFRVLRVNSVKGKKVELLVSNNGLERNTADLAGNTDDE